MSKPKEGICGHPALFTWHYTGYVRVSQCPYCELAAAQVRIDNQAGEIERLTSSPSPVRWTGSSNAR